MPAPRHDTLYADAKYTPPPQDPRDLAGKPAMHLKDIETVEVLKMEGATPEPQESRRGRHDTPDAVVRDQARCLASVDEGMGMVLDALWRKGQLENTVVIFTSDNGYLMGEHGQFDQKRWPYEDSLRIPFLLRYPKLVKAGSRPTTMALNIDVTPTLLDIAGVKPLDKLHGASLVPALRDPGASVRKSFLAEHFVEKVVPKVPDWQAVRTERWKYVHYPTLKDMDELYGLQADPREIVNIIGALPSAEPLRQMQAQLRKLFTESGERLKG